MDEERPSVFAWPAPQEPGEPASVSEPPAGIEDEPAGDETEPTEGRSPTVVVLSAALVLAVALAAVFGVLWVRNVGPSAESFGEFIDETSPDVREKATSIATLLMNYDSTNLAEVGRRLLELSTGNFAEDYENVLAGGLGDALEEASASSRGQILDGPDVYFSSASEAIALLRLTQTTQSNETPGGQSFIYVMKITLVDTRDEGWKADRVEILSQERAT